MDVEDDGDGVAVGAEELIFQRFFQGQGASDKVAGSKRLKRGLGVGLYLARCICEQHGGRLQFIRGAGRHGLFRFLFPMKAEQPLDLFEPTEHAS